MSHVAFTNKVKNERLLILTQQIAQLDAFILLFKKTR